jgi:prepilin-type N-terminal cleavage/methylation domain-containing protein
MKGKSRISRQESVNFRNRFARKQKGFTLIEMVVAVGIIGIIALVLYPSILNTLETRKLENTTRQVVTSLQRAKFEAVKTRINHRLRFDYINQGEMNLWSYVVEREDNPGSWNSMPGFNRKFMPAEFNVTVNFPNQIVQFSPLGFISNYNVAQSSLTVQSAKLNDYNTYDERVVSIYVGGSVQYTKSQGGE